MIAERNSSPYDSWAPIEAARAVTAAEGSLDEALLERTRWAEDSGLDPERREKVLAHATGNVAQAEVGLTLAQQATSVFAETYGILGAPLLHAVGVELQE